MAEVRIEDPGEMNVLGLVLAAALRRNLPDDTPPPKLRGALTVDAEGMRATVVFAPEGVTVTRAETKAAAVVAAPLHRLVEAVVRPSIFRLLGLGMRGRRLFALRAMRYLAP
ncbi:MAG: hypothetical protein ACYS99_22645 [Planctomycetota bacterium]